MIRRRKQPEGDGGPLDVYTGLRTQALDAAGTQSPAPSHPDVLGVVIDIPLDDSHLTVMTLADGTTSMYTSTGGGTIGAGAHASVVSASTVLLDQLQSDLVLFPGDKRTNLPEPGMVQITVLTPKGRQRANLPEPAFWGEEPSTLQPLISAMQDLITAIRTAETPA